MNAIIYTFDVRQFQNEEKYEQVLASMPLKRQEKVLSYLFEKDRFLSLGAGFILSCAFAEYAISLENIEIDSFGKPYCKDKSLFFNLSHSGYLACGIFSKNAQVGIDIEQIKDTSLFEECKDLLFHEEEKKWLQNIFNLAKHDKLRIYYAIWTLKEAYLKALGRGLTLKPSHILFPQKMYAHVLEQISSKKEALQFHADFESNYLLSQIFIDENYSFSTCIKKNEAQKNLTNFEYQIRPIYC